MHEFPVLLPSFSALKRSMGHLELVLGSLGTADPLPRQFAEHAPPDRTRPEVAETSPPNSKTKWPTVVRQATVERAAIPLVVRYSFSGSLACDTPLVRLGFLRCGSAIRLQDKESCATNNLVSQPQSITQKGVHTHPLTARERKHCFLQHLTHCIALNFGRQ